MTQPRPTAVDVRVHEDGSFPPPGDIGRLVRDVLMPWPDTDTSSGSGREPRAGVLAFTPRTGRWTAITAPATSAGLDALAGSAPAHVPAESLVILALRAETLTEDLVEPLTEAQQSHPGPADVGLPGRLRDRLGTLITRIARVSHVDSVLVTEHAWWSVHCTAPCPGCSGPCSPVPRSSAATAAARHDLARKVKEPAPARPGHAAMTAVHPGRFRSTAERLAAVLGTGWTVADRPRRRREAPATVTTTLYGPDDIALTLSVSGLAPGRWWIDGRLSSAESWHRPHEATSACRAAPTPADLWIDDDPSADPGQMAETIAAQIHSRYLPGWLAHVAAARAAVARVEASRARVAAVGEQIIARFGDHATWYDRPDLTGTPGRAPDRDTVEFERGGVHGQISITDQPGPADPDHSPTDDETADGRPGADVATGGAADGAADGGICTVVVLAYGPPELALDIADLITGHHPR